jgi:predicted lipoprotein with Yx(FWY)xxD motif
VPLRARGAGALALATALTVASLVAAPLATYAQDAEGATVSATSGDLGTYLVGPDGRTLYYFTRDVTPGASVCEGGCLENWPPLTVEDGQAITAGEGVTGTLGTFARSDGTTQVAYRGRPLYFFAGDAAAGETKGQGLNEVWFVATVDGSSPPNPPEEGAPSPGPVGLTIETASSDLGTFLTGRDGLTLYYFAVDAVPGVSACEGDCLAAWPPATVAAGETVAAGDGVTGVLGLITGTDGNPQVTYDGRPLYHWQGDTEAGQTTGHGVGDVWWVADVSGDLPAAPVAAESMAPVESMAPAG